MKILELKKITKKYKDKLALNDINLTLSSGEIFSIVGPNGSGKTTLVKIISKYLTPDSGEIIVTDSKKLSIGVSYGGPLGFYGEVSVYQNLKFYAHLDKIKWREIKERVNKVIKMVNLEDFSKKKFSELSLGMKQRVHIAKALLKNPNLLILDEPTNGVDVDVARLIRENIVSLKSQGVSIVMTSHIMKDIEKLSDKIALIDNGEIFHIGDLKSITDMANQYGEKVNDLEEAYLRIFDIRKKNR